MLTRAVRMDLKGVSGISDKKHARFRPLGDRVGLNTPGLASLFVQSRAYQMSVTFPALVPVAPLWIRIVVALADWMSTLDWRLMNTMWVPPAVADPAVMVAS